MNKYMVVYDYHKKQLRVSVYVHEATIRFFRPAIQITESQAYGYWKEYEAINPLPLFKHDLFVQRGVRIPLDTPVHYRVM